MISDGFKEYCLSKYSRHTALERISYASRYSELLETRNFSTLALMPESKRLHVLASLSALAKYQGSYSEFQELVKGHGIKWIQNRDQVLINRISRSINPDDIISWVIQIRHRIPELDLFIEYLTISGMRLVEGVMSYNKIIELQDKVGQYYNIKTNALENYRFPEFIRKTKKSYIVFIPSDMIVKVSRERPITVHNVLKLTQTRDLRCRYSDLRELHATLLSQTLTPSEIDFLHGRIGSSVFMTNYFNPSLIGDLQVRTLEAIARIRSKIKIVA